MSNKTCTIYIEHPIDSEGNYREDYRVSMTDNDVWDMEYTEHDTVEEAYSEAEGYKIELEAEGYTVTVVWDCMKPAWASF